MIFKGIRTSFAIKPYIFVIFQGEFGPPATPTPSGSAHGNSLYDKYKRLRRPTDRCAFLEAKHLVEQKLRLAHNRYIKEILGFTNSLEQPESNCQSSPDPHKSTLASKKLFSILKNSKQDSKGIAPLKKDGKLYSDTVDKANVLNQQFQSVFTQKCPLKLSQLASMAVQDLSDNGTIDPSQIPGECLNSTPQMESITVSTNGFAKLFKDLNPHKAAGVDQIKPLVLAHINRHVQLIVFPYYLSK